MNDGDKHIVIHPVNVNVINNMPPLKVTYMVSSMNASTGYKIM